MKKRYSEWNLDTIKVFAYEYRLKMYFQNDLFQLKSQRSMSGKLMNELFCNSTTMYFCIEKW